MQGTAEILNGLDLTPHRTRLSSIAAFRDLDGLQFRIMLLDARAAARDSRGPAFGLHTFEMRPVFELAPCFAVHD
jgi:hypothetical protein